MDREAQQRAIRDGEALRIARTVKKLSRRELALAAGLESWDLALRIRRAPAHRRGVPARLERVELMSAEPSLTKGEREELGKLIRAYEWKPLQARRASAEEVCTWWRQWPEANVGIVTGMLCRSPPPIFSGRGPPRMTSPTPPVPLVEGEYLTAVELGKLLRLSEKTIERWAAQDATMPCLRIGGLEGSAAGREEWERAHAAALPACPHPGVAPGSRAGGVTRRQYQKPLHSVAQGLDSSGSEPS